MTAEAVVPRLRPGVKFRFDAARAAYVLLAPERVFQPDAVASEVLRRVDGERTLGVIIDELADAFCAPRPTIAADVAAMLRDLAGKGVVSL